MLDNIKKTDHWLFRSGKCLHLQQVSRTLQRRKCGRLCSKALRSQLHVSSCVRRRFGLYRSCQFALLNCPLPSSPTFIAAEGVSKAHVGLCIQATYVVRSVPLVQSFFAFPDCHICLFFIMYLDVQCFVAGTIWLL